MNIHCPIFSAVCFIYLFKWFLSLCLSNPLLRFSLFFPLCTVAQKRSWSPKAADVFSTTKSRIWCTEQRRAKNGVWLWSKKLLSTECLPNPMREVTILPFSQLELPSITKWIGVMPVVAFFYQNASAITILIWLFNCSQISLVILNIILYRHTIEMDWQHLKSKNMLWSVKRFFLRKLILLKYWNI